MFYTQPGTGATKVSFAAQSTGDGWVSLAFPETVGVMIGSVAVLGWVTAAGAGSVDVYDLVGKDVSGVTVRTATDGPIIKNTSVEEVRR